MGLVVFLAVVGALTIYAFHTLFNAPIWGFIAALSLFIVGMNASDPFRTNEQNDHFAAKDGAGTERSPQQRSRPASVWLSELGWDGCLRVSVAMSCPRICS
jgi:hypothetical protein